MIKFKNTQIINSINVFLSQRLSAVGLILAAAVFTAGCLFLIFPKYKEIKKEIKLAGERENIEYVERYKYYGQLKKINNDYENINKDDAEKVMAMIPEEKFQEELLAYLENFVLKNGLLLTDANITEGEAGQDEIKKIIINMNVVGADYGGFKKLLNEMENNLRILDVNSLSFDPENQSASFNITAYYFKSKN